MIECICACLLLLCCVAFYKSSQPISISISKTDNKLPSIIKHTISGYIDIAESAYIETCDDDFSKAWKSTLVFTDGRKLTLWGLPDCQLEDEEYYFFDYDSKFNLLRTYQ